MGFLKLFVFTRAMDYVIDYVDKNWDTLVSKGKVYVIQWLTTIKLKLGGEDTKPIFGDAQFDDDMASFASGLQHTINEAEEQSPTDDE
jgi:hypothetical protein